MRKLFFVTITVIFAAFASLPPAFAGGNPGDENLGRLTDCEVRELTGEPLCRRLTQEEAFILGKTIEALGRVAGAAIANERRDYRPRPGHYSERYARPSYTLRGQWVEKWRYEQFGRACPGPIAHWDNTYWCRVR